MAEFSNNNAGASSSRSPPKSPMRVSPAAHSRSFSRELEADEQSPLLAPSKSSFDDDDENKIPSIGSRDTEQEENDWTEEEHVSRSSWYMFLLTLGGFGLQMGWAVEMSNGSPYLLSLGLDKALLALVWLAGPLSGVIVQPYVGIKSDRCRSRWGKRRPFVAAGALSTMVSVMALAWAREIVGGFYSIFGVESGSNAVRITIMVFAVFFVYVLDFAINVLQAGIRAYAVDCAPAHQQEIANAWISRMIGVGNIVGMGLGGINLPRYFPFLGNSQFKVLCALAAISMAVSVSISVASVRERDPRQDTMHPNSEDSLLQIFRSLWRSLFRLPPQISAVCKVQFLAWMGWFPFLFYTSTFIGEIYVEPFFEANPHMTQSEINAIWDEGTRRGSVALLVFAIVTFAGNVILPFLIVPTFQAPKPSNDLAATPLTPTHSLSGSYLSVKSSMRPTLQKRITTLLTKLQIPGLTLRRTWLYSHLLFCGCMWATLFTRSVLSATLLVGAVGICWAVTMWAPFALIASEISRRDAIRRGVLRARGRDAQLLAAGEDDSADQAGVVLGIHNVSISAPQVIATLVGSVLFHYLQKPRGTPGDTSVAWFFRLGGLCALGAAWLTHRVGEDKGEDDG
ncbi:MFS general substrate transporter [Microthyrium microscopicum]|uniref:MFS general substrate transporter n=1 Tax=Microthyrium microscopicum TaxID=703497 RepID=A0A6A6U3Z4_9PEZI|nr:MFS general substrate transporter [Microthyrium microscopicum]